MPTFSDLPCETLCDIFSHLPNVDLTRIGGLSHRLHDITQPLIYKTPYLPRVHQKPNSLAAWPSRELFLRTLLTPAGATLATHVRCLRVEWDSNESERATECLSDSLTVRSAIASRLSLNYPLWSQGAQLMLIFDLLPRLRILHIIPANGTPTYSNYSFARFLDRSINPGTLPQALHSLHSFHCPSFTSPGTSGISGWTMLMLLKLPNIRTIDIPNFSRRKISMRILHGEATSSSITKLRFSAAYIPLWALSFILRAPIALTHFSYSATRSDNLNPVRFMEVLVPLRTSLRSLHLDLNNTCMSPNENQRLHLTDTACSLREWTALRTLSCGLTLLLATVPQNIPSRLVNALPASIRELEILSEWGWPLSKRISQVEELLWCKGQVVPVLERVAVVSAKWGDGGTGELGVACEAAGVRLVEEICRW